MPNAATPGAAVVIYGSADSCQQDTEDGEFNGKENGRRNVRDRLAVINPGAVIGPLLADDPGTSVSAIQQIMAGALPMIPDLRLPWVHVRGIADAHVEAMTSASAGVNRTIVATDPSSLIDVAAVLRQWLPEASGKMPGRAMPAGAAAAGRTSTAT